MAQASLDTGVEAQGNKSAPDIHGRYGPGGVSFSHLASPLPALGVGVGSGCIPPVSTPTCQRPWQVSSPELGLKETEQAPGVLITGL